MASTAASELRSPTSMSLARVVDSLHSHPMSIISEETTSDTGSALETITKMGHADNIPGQLSTINTAPEQLPSVEEWAVNRKIYDGNISRHQSGKRRKVDDQISSLVFSLNMTLIVSNFSGLIFLWNCANVQGLRYLSCLVARHANTVRLNVIECSQAVCGVKEAVTSPLFLFPPLPLDFFIEVYCASLV